MTDPLTGSPLTGAPYPGAPVTYVEALDAGVELRTSRWGLPDVVIALLISLFVPAFLVAGLLAAGLSSTGSVVLLASVMTPWLGFGLWPILTTRFQGNGVKVDLGLSLRRSDLMWGVGGGVACLVLGTVVSDLTEKVLGHPFDSAAGDALAKATVPTWVVVAFTVCATVGAPLFEELCFRGLVFASLAKSLARRGVPPVPWATFGSALLFALIHLEPVRIPLLLAIGLVLSLLRARTGRIGASIVAHAFNNSAALVLSVLMVIR